MTAIVYQAGDALLYTAMTTLRGDTWDNHVYIDEAPTNVASRANVWVVIRLLADVRGGVRGDRDERVLTIRVNCVSENKDSAWLAAGRVYALLNNAGTQDRSSTTFGTHSEWDFLTFTAGRSFNLTPSKEFGTQFFESGYEFTVKMEAKSGYS